MNIKQLNEVNSYIESEIAPGIHAHGGDIKLHKLEDGNLSLELTGACVICPADQMTRTGIELQIKSKFDFIEDISFESAKSENISEFNLSI